MMIAKLIFNISVLKLLSHTTIAKEWNVLNSIIKYNLKDVYTCCVFNMEDNMLSHFIMDSLVPVITLNSNIITFPENLKYCDGYIMYSTNVRHFAKTFFTFTFLVHKRFLIFLEEPYISGSFIERAAYNRALNLIIVDNFATEVDGETSNVIFVTTNKTKIIGKHHVTQDDFDNSWSPDMFITKLGREISVSLFHCPPYVSVNTFNEFEGIDFEIFKAVAKDWPVKYYLEKTQLNTRSNFFVKIIEKVQLNEVDISMCGLWERVLLERKVDFSTWYSTTCLTFLVAKPLLLGDTTFVFQPFWKSLWFFILCAVVALSAFNVCIAKTVNVVELKKQSTSNWMLLLGYFSPGPSAPKSPMKSIRILFQYWAVFCMVVQAYYSAGLTISLRFPRFSREISSFEDMINLNIRWEEPLSDIQNWLLQTNDRLHENLGNLYFSGNDIDAMNGRLRTGNYALLVKLVDKRYAMNAEDLDDFGKTNLKAIPQCFADFYTVFAFQKNSPFTEIFNIEINKLIETGLVSRWEKMYTTSKDTEYMRNFFENVEYEVRQTIGLLKLQGGFYLLVFGYVAGLVAFTTECILSKK